MQYSIISEWTDAFGDPCNGSEPRTLGEHESIEEARAAFDATTTAKHPHNHVSLMHHKADTSYTVASKDV